MAERDQGPESNLAYWRGRIDANIRNIEATVAEIHANLNDMRQEIRSANLILYKIMGIGIAIATILPLILPRLFGWTKP